MASVAYFLAVSAAVIMWLSLVHGIEDVEFNGIAMVTDKPADEVVMVESFADILGHHSLVDEFTKFSLKYGKSYKSVHELRHRFSTYISSVDLIEKINSQKLSYKLGINKFADMTHEEFKGSYLQSKLFGQQDCSATKGGHKLTAAKLPENKDWRLHNIVSPVKNQASCGSCWTFSTTGALESAHAQATGHMVLLSEQQLVDCAGAFNNFGCGGGLPSQAFEYIRYSGGIETEAAYPYAAKDQVCQFDGTHIGATVYDVVNITSGAEDELLDAVAFSRPVSVAFEVIDEFRLYKSGIFSSPRCHDSAQTVNHAVLAVGYDTDENGTPYWIIKNSWGADWGQHGYFGMELGKNMCGVATCASYPVVPEDLLR